MTILINLPSQVQRRNLPILKCYVNRLSQGQNKFQTERDREIESVDNKISTPVLSYAVIPIRDSK